MIRHLLTRAIPIVVLVDCALAVTWLTMMSIDGIGRPSRFSLLSLLIAMTVIAIHLGIIAAVALGGD